MIEKTLKLKRVKESMLGIVPGLSKMLALGKQIKMNREQLTTYQAKHTKE